MAETIEEFLHAPMFQGTRVIPEDMTRSIIQERTRDYINPLLNAVNLVTNISGAVNARKRANAKIQQTKNLHQGFENIKDLLKQELNSKYQIGQQNIISRYTPKISADKKLGTPMTNAEVQKALSYNTPSTSVYTIGNIEGGSDSITKNVGWSDPPLYPYKISIIK